MCGLGVTLPPLEMLAPPGPPPGSPPGAPPLGPPQQWMPPGPPQYGQPPQGPPMGMPPGPPPGMPPQPLSLACPICGGGFLIPPELAGQQVACPHCHQPVAVPGGGSFAPPSAPLPMPPSAPASVPQGKPVPVQADNAPPPTFLYPPGFEPPGLKETKAAPAPAPAPVSTPSSDRWSSKGTTNKPSEPVPGRTAPQPRHGEKGPAPAPAKVEPASMYPPGMAPPQAPTKPAAPAPTPTTAPIDSRYPPGMNPPGKVEAPLRPIPVSKVEAAPTPTPVETKPTPAPVVAPSSPAPSRPAAKSKIDELLPPGADVDDLLPPGAADVPTALATPSTPIAASTTPVEDPLLPPGMGEVPVGGPLQQVALPEEEMARQMRELNRPLPPPDAPKDAVLIPTDDGKYVALREPVKTIGKGLEERELHVLPPEVKQKRRLVRNFVVYTIMLLILIAAFYLLLNV